MIDGQDRTGTAYDRTRGALLLAAALLAAAATRLYMWLTTDFPINDGGPFVAVIDQIAPVFPAIPAAFDWNGLVIPFAYPPLAFWLGALLKNAGVSGISTLHTLPIFMNVGFICLFALLLLRAGYSRVFAALAVLFLATALRSFEWLVMGGGLTRGLGSLFLILALLAATIPGPRAEAPASLGRMMLVGAAVAGAILSHLEWGLLAACSLVASRAFQSRGLKEFVISSTIAGVTALLLVIPWLAWILRTNGLDPLIAASATSEWQLVDSIRDLIFLGIDALLTNPFILLGGLAMLWRRQFFWVAFALLCLFVTPRHGPTPLALAYAVFAGQGVMTLYGFLKDRTRSRGAALPITAAAAVLAGALQGFSTVGRAQNVRPLSPQVREAMAWIAANQPGATFAVFTGKAWPTDSSAEWFPTVSGAQSVTTVQGREWLPDRAFHKSVAAAKRLRESKTCPELHAALRAYPPFDFVWVETMRHCFTSPAHERVYQNRQVDIFRARLSAPATGMGGPS